jgi:hypothetical protein
MTGNNTNARSVPRKPGDAPGLCASRSTKAAAADGHDGQPRPDTPAADRVRKPWLFAAAGATAAAVPAGPGFALAAAGHPQAVPLLITSGVIGLMSVIAGSAVKIYDSTQRTRRLQIQHASTTAIATAMARCIDAAHTAAPGLPARQRATEAADVRASAMQMVTEMMPAVIAVIERQSPALDDLNARTPGRQRPPGPAENPGKIARLHGTA